MNYDVNLEEMKKEAQHRFYNGYTCSESVLHTLNKHYEFGLSADAIAMGAGFPWGLGGAGCICGAVAGATMSLGYMYGRRDPEGDKDTCFKLTKEFHDEFLEKFGSVGCGKLIENMDRDTPERKDKCSYFVDFTIDKIAQIIARER